MLLREEEAQPYRGPKATFLPDMPKAPKPKVGW